MYDEEDYIDDYPDLDEVLDDEDPFSDFDMPPINNDDVKKDDEDEVLDDTE